MPFTKRYFAALGNFAVDVVRVCQSALWQLAEHNDTARLHGSDLSMLGLHQAIATGAAVEPALTSVADAFSNLCRLRIGVCAVK
jgi:hypothetical protein